jgi:hypothetical protein
MLSSQAARNFFSPIFNRNRKTNLDYSAQTGNLVLMFYYEKYFIRYFPGLLSLTLYIKVYKGKRFSQYSIVTTDGED